MSDTDTKTVVEEHDHQHVDCNCENGDCECCQEGCACPNDECLCGWDTEDTQAEKYALLAEEAYEELIKEKLKKKFLENEADLDKVVDIAFRAAMHRWDEIDRGEYDGEIWDKFEEELQAVWKK